jgi:ssDNA thymidine ADP-ribosyltransferase, DarT
LRIKKVVELSEVKIYRLTHIENIPHILQYGITHKDSANRNPDYKNIGDISLINTRKNKTVIINNGEHSLKADQKTIKLGEYIPFYFGVRMPMLYVAQHGGNFVEQATPPEDIIYLGCSVDEIISAEIGFFFTDGHATDMLTSFYDKTEIDKLIEIVDWIAVKSAFWGGVDNLDIKRKKQAEFLVSCDLSPAMIIGFGCYNHKAMIRLLSYGVAESKIKIIPQAYY